MDTSSLQPQALDALREVMNIGSAHAATALSQMVHETVDVTAPRLEVRSIETIPTFVGPPDSVVSVVLLKVLGDAPGVMLLMFPQESAKKIAQALTHHQGQTLLDELDHSALQEVGNVLAGSCFAALSTFLGMSFLQSVPNAATDMLGSLLDGILSDLGEHFEHVLASEVHFSIPSLKAEGSVFFIFDPQSTQKILAALQRKFGAASA